MTLGFLIIHWIGQKAACAARHAASPQSFIRAAARVFAAGEAAWWARLWLKPPPSAWFRNDGGVLAGPLAADHHGADATTAASVAAVPLRPRIHPRRAFLRAIVAPPSRVCPVRLSAGGFPIRGAGAGVVLSEHRARMGRCRTTRSAEIPLRGPPRPLRAGRRGPPRRAAPQRRRRRARRHSFIGADPFKVLACRDGVVEIDGVRGRRAPRRAARRARPPPPGRRSPASAPFRGGAVGVPRATRWAATWSASRPRPPTRWTSRRCSCCSATWWWSSTTARGAPTIISTGHPEPVRDGGACGRWAAARVGAPPGGWRRGVPPAPTAVPAAAAADRVGRLARGLRDLGRAAGRRLHPRRRHLPGEPLAAPDGAELPAGSRPARPLSPPAAGNPAPFAAYLELGRRRDRLVVARALPAPSRRPRWRRARSRGRARGARRPPRTTALAAELARQREGPRRERDDRGPPAQRPLAGLPRRQRRGRPSCAPSSASPRSIHLVSTVTGRAAARAGAGRPARGRLSRRLHHRGAEDPGDGDHRASSSRPAAAPTAARIGYLGFDGSMDTSIVIRTFTIRGEQVTFQVGGGVVADSDARGRVRGDAGQGPRPDRGPVAVILVDRQLRLVRLQPGALRPRAGRPDARWCATTR